MNFLFRAAILAGFFGIAFAGTMVLAFPTELVAERYVFPMLQEKTGIPMSARSIDFAFPFGVAMGGVSVGTADPTGSVPFEIDRLQVAPGWRVLLAEPNVHFALGFAGGELKGSSGKGTLELEAHDIDLERLSFLEAGGKKRFAGKIGFEGRFPLSPAEPSGKGDLALSVKGLRIEDIEFMGLKLPGIDVGKFEGRLVLENSRIRIENGRSSGGNVQLEASGFMHLVKPMRQSQLDFTLQIKFPEPTLEKMGETGKLIRMAQRSQGSINVGLVGPLGNPQFQPR